MKDFVNITMKDFQDENFECECGNTSFDRGFFTCDEAGNEIEPTIDSGWDGLYVCAGCEKIFKIVKD